MSYAGNNGATSSSSRSRVCFIANEAHGQLGGVGQYGENRFVLIRDVGSSSSLGRVDEEETEDQEDDPTRLFLCYGDKITLRSGIMKRVLGVQTEKVTSREIINNSNDTAMIIGQRQQSLQRQRNHWRYLLFSHELGSRLC